jgi:hypothetical protein
MMLEIIVTHLEKVCGLEQNQGLAPEAGQVERSNEPIDEKTGSLAKPLEETNLDEIVHLLKLLQETIRMSSDTQKAMA